MKWTVLSDNRSCDDSLETEHGLSILLETEKYGILLDTGASDVFIRNAEKMGIDLSTVDYVFISHGHSDHAGGLRPLMMINEKAQVIVSPDAVSGKFFSKRRYLHSITAEWPEEMLERTVFVNDSIDIADGLHIIAHIPQNHPMPQGNQYLFVQTIDDESMELGHSSSACLLPTGKATDGQPMVGYRKNGRSQYVNDDFRHELALYTNGLLFTGCAHSGLENILAACPYPVKTVVGGFHLLDDHETTEELTQLAERLTKAYPHTQFYTSHCTGDKVFATLKTIMGNQLHAFSCGRTI